MLFHLIGPIERFEQYLLDISYPVFSRYSLQSATEYLQIFVQHVHLYQYLLTDTQEENKHSITLDLMIGPVNVSRLNEGCLEKKWLEREKLENLEESYIESKKELESFKNIALKEKREKLQKVYDDIVKDFSSSATIIEDKLKNIVESIVTVSNILTDKDLVLLCRNI